MPEAVFPEVNSFYGIEDANDEINVLPEDEPEFVEVEMAFRFRRHSPCGGPSGLSSPQGQRKYRQLSRTEAWLCRRQTIA